MTLRSTNRARRTHKRLIKTFWGLVACFVVVSAVTVFYAVTAAPTTSAEPLPTTTPRVMVSPPPVAPPTTAPPVTPTPTPQPAEPWTFQGAWLEIPCVGISGPITEYTAAMLVDGAVEPATMDTISWYSGIPGGILSGAATNTNYVYGHSWINPAIFNGVRRMTPGCEAIITTENGETLTYVMNEPVFPVMKPELSTDPRVTEAKAGRLVLVSCYRPDGYNPNAPTVENVVAVLQLAPPAPVVVDSSEQHVQTHFVGRP